MKKINILVVIVIIELIITRALNYTKTLNINILYISVMLVSIRPQDSTVSDYTSNLNMKV